MMEAGLGKFANPSSIFKATEMLLRHIGRTEAADRLAAALTICNETERRIVVTGDRNGAACAEFSDYLISVL
jgi:isocitrate dehydrogenase (NAD+)